MFVLWFFFVFLRDIALLQYAENYPQMELTLISQQLRIDWSCSCRLWDAYHMIDWSHSRNRYSWTNGRLLPLLTDYLNEPTLNNASISLGVAQLTGHLTAVALNIVKLTDPGMIWSWYRCRSDITIAVALDFTTAKQVPQLEIHGSDTADWLLDCRDSQLFF